MSPQPQGLCIRRFHINSSQATVSYPLAHLQSLIAAGALEECRRLQTQKQSVMVYQVPMADAGIPLRQQVLRVPIPCLTFFPGTFPIMVRMQILTWRQLISIAGRRTQVERGFLSHIRRLMFLEPISSQTRDPSCRRRQVRALLMS